MSRFFLASVLTVSFCVLSACDSAPTASSVTAESFVEGVYTLPDGTTGTFRTAGVAEAQPYSGLGTRDVFAFGTRFADPQQTPEQIVVQLRFQQSGLAPSPGRMTTNLYTDTGGRALVQGGFTIANVPGVQIDGVLPYAESYLTVALPSGTLDLDVEDDVLHGRFALEGRAFSLSDTTLVTRVEGKFQIPYNPDAKR